MATTTDTKQIVAPYVPWETFTDAIKHLKAVAVPSQIDKSALPSSMAPLVKGQVQSALRFLGLIADGNKTTKILKPLVDAYDTPEWAEHLMAIVPKSYTSILGDLVLVDATQQQLDERFAAVGVKGQMALKSIRFYLAALSAAGIRYSPHLTARRKSAPWKKAANRTATKKNGQKPPTPRQKNTTPQIPDSTIAYPVGAPPRAIHVPSDITEAEVGVIETLIPALRAFAKAHSKGGQ